MGEVGGYANASVLRIFEFLEATKPLITLAIANITIGKIMAIGKLVLSIKEPMNIFPKMITV